MSGSFFVDTNILVYAHDRGSGRKHRAAKELVTRLWHERSGVLSTQVLQEFYVNIRRKAEHPVGVTVARGLIGDYLSWNVVVNDGAAVLQAVDFEKRYKISFWDALIIQAANVANVSVLYTEDLNHGQTYGMVETCNPFV